MVKKKKVNGPEVAKYFFPVKGGCLTIIGKKLFATPFLF